jgi:hypothetical protein
MPVTLVIKLDLATVSSVKQGAEPGVIQGSTPGSEPGLKYAQSQGHSPEQSNNQPGVRLYVYLYYVLYTFGESSVRLSKRLIVMLKGMIQAKYIVNCSVYDRYFRIFYIICLYFFISIVDKSSFATCQLLYNCHSTERGNQICSQ